MMQATGCKLFLAHVPYSGLAWDSITHEMGVTPNAIFSPDFPQPN
jgi:hypothetical protein